MVKVGKFFSGKFLKPVDLEQDSQIVEIQGGREHRFQDGEDKWICKFKEYSKPLPLNTINGKRLEAEWGDESDDWIGKKVELYRTQGEFRGEIMDVIRIRIPSQSAAPVEVPTPAEWEEEKDSVW